MSDQTEDPEIMAVRREETSRGRRPIDTEQEELTRKFKRDFEELLLNGSQKQFRAFLSAHGQQVGTERYEASMKLWDVYQRNRYNRP